jgi:hypothetical protein
MADLKVNNITNYDGTTGPVIAGVSTVLSTSHFVVPVGNTFKRSVTENIVNDGLVLYLDAGNDVSYDAYENLALNSEAINSWDNNGNAISISVNSQVAPDGTLTADVLSQTVVTGASRWVSSMTRTYTAGVTYTLSIWLKKISGTDAQPGINLWVEGGTSQSVGTITTEWVRYSKSFTPASTISSSTFTGLNIGWNDNGAANNFTFAAWGFQVETGSSVGPYYPTTGAAKTRGTTWTDLSGNNNTGTLTNGPTYSSANGGSIVFDGVNDYVDLISTIQFDAGDFSISGWFRSNSGNTNFKQIWSSGYNGGNPDVEVAVSQTSNTLYFYIRTVSFVQASVQTSYSVDDNVWRHFTVTKTSSLISLYVNGSFIGNTSGSFAEDVDSAGVIPRIGNGVSGINNRPFIGNIPQVSIYNRALSAAEVSQNFNATRSRYGI